MSQPYHLAWHPHARRALYRQPVKVVDAVITFAEGALATDPYRVGKPLGPPFEGDYVARRSSYRLRYRVDEDKHTVLILDLVGRADVYYPGRS